MHFSPLFYATLMPCSRAFCYVTQKNKKNMLIIEKMADNA